MPSLSQLLTGHGTLLVLDAASMDVQVGLLRSGGPAFWRSTREEAGTALFRSVAAVLKEARAGLDEVEAFVFCEGPGSMLGVRTAAMTLRTWQVLKPRPVYAFQSLAVAALAELAKGKVLPFAVIADARRDAWHCQAVTAGGRLTPLQRLPATGLPDGELLTPGNFRAWAPLPRPTGTCPYDLAAMFSAIPDGDCFRAVDAPDAFQHSPPDYKKWSARVHRAATAHSK